MAIDSLRGPLRKEHALSEVSNPIEMGTQIRPFQIELPKPTSTT